MDVRAWFLRWSMLNFMFFFHCAIHFGVFRVLRTFHKSFCLFFDFFQLSFRASFIWCSFWVVSSRILIFNILFNFLLFVQSFSVWQISLLSLPIQLLIRSGRSAEESLMILVPEAYKNHPTLMIKYPEVFFSWQL